MKGNSCLTIRSDHAGKRVGGAFYLHVSAVPGADQAMRERIERAAVAAERPDWNVAKVQGDAVSLLTYEAFDEVAFPALLAAVRVNLSDGIVTRTDYRERANPPILHRKETLLRPDDPRRPAFAALTRLAEEHKLFAEPHRIAAELYQPSADGFLKRRLLGDDFIEHATRQREAGVGRRGQRARHIGQRAILQRQNECLAGIGKSPVQNDVLAFGLGAVEPDAEHVPQLLGA